MKEQKNTIELPKEWKHVKLGDIAKVKGGKRLPKGEQYSQEKTNFPYLRVVDFESMTINQNDLKYLTEETQRKIKNYTITSEDLYISIAGTIGRVGKVPLLLSGSNLTENAAKITDIKEFDLNYLSLQLNSGLIQNQIYEKTIATTQPKLALYRIEKLDLILPPKPTQQAIVSKIEELFSELDKGIENLRLAQQQLKTHRQSVLKWAFEGRLTNENVKEGELPEGWRWTHSGDYFDLVTSGSRGWAKYYADQGAIFIRITNLDFDSLELDLDENKIQYVNPPLTSEGIRTKVHEGDFLFSITGYLGMLAIAPKLENAYVNQHVCLCRPKNNFNKKYLGYWVISKSGGHHYLNKNKKGAVKAGLNLDDLKSFPVPLCAIEEQNKIVQEIESRLSEVDKMEESISQSLQQAEALRQSILKKAFEGKLIVNKIG